MAKKQSSIDVDEHLLRQIFTDPLEHGYHLVASDHERYSASTGFLGKLATVVLTTLLVASTIFAIKDLTARNLENDVLDPLRTQVSDLQAEVKRAEASNSSLSSQIQNLTNDEDILQLNPGDIPAVTSLSAVSGPGIRVVISDANYIAASDPEADSKRVQDRDLQTIINQLWQSGAEAVTVNGIRVGPQTAIRAAGGAVLVNLTPVSSPYQIDAIGSRNDLLKGLSTGSAADFLGILQTRYGITTEITQQTDIRMRAGAYHSYKTVIIPE
ncbi:DUF881 domain-containing protein [Boudabousia marimammalium]|uniref:DUF881 domain-containing protein n=1 Tax=Boudabousia marimammalium TaxID=156892 RepID=A0A1Q5PQY3_9ACTO|nr:DUF881 domain-containing protein [Boudabousia marimammalium]OKL49984.1 hypothetical protein BM477_03565 [Boudabousia marimammalium]